VFDLEAKRRSFGILFLRENIHKWWDNGSTKRGK